MIDRWLLYHAMIVMSNMLLMKILVMSSVIGVKKIFLLNIEKLYE